MTKFQKPLPISGTKLWYKAHDRRTRNSYEKLVRETRTKNSHEKLARNRTRSIWCEKLAREISCCKSVWHTYKFLARVNSHEFLVRVSRTCVMGLSFLSICHGSKVWGFSCYSMHAHFPLVVAGWSVTQTPISILGITSCSIISLQHHVMRPSKHSTVNIQIVNRELYLQHRWD